MIISLYLISLLHNYTIIFTIKRLKSSNKINTVKTINIHYTDSTNKIVLEKIRENDRHS
jgi:hypothetical protein